MSIVAIALLRPDPGETAAGTRRSAPTTVPSTPEPSFVTNDGQTAATTIPVGRAVVHDGPVDIVSILPWTASYIALANGSDELLHIHSTNGQTWSRLPTLIVDVEPAQVGPDLTVSRSFSALGEGSDRALVVSMTESFHDVLTRAPRGAKVTRLSSPDGLLWSPDPAFEPIEFAGGIEAIPLMNTADLVVVGAYRDGTGNPLIEKVLGEYVSDDTIANGCWLDAWSIFDPRGDAVAQLQPCGDGVGPVTLSRHQLVDRAARQAGFGQCIAELSGRSGAPLDIYMGSRGEPTVRIYTEQGTVSAIPVETASGKVAVLEPGRSLAGAPACAAFDVFDAEAPTAPGVLLIAPGKGSQRISTAGALPDTRLFGLPQSIAVTERELFIPTEAGVISFDRQTGESALRAGPINRAGTVWTSPDGRGFFTFAAQSMFVADVADGTWSAIELDRRVSPDRLLFADDDRAFFLEGSAVVVVELSIDG